MSKKALSILSHGWIFIIAVTLTMTVFDSSHWWLLFLSMAFLIVSMGIVETLKEKEQRNVR